MAEGIAPEANIQRQPMALSHASLLPPPASAMP